MIAFLSRKKFKALLKYRWQKFHHVFGKVLIKLQWNFPALKGSKARTWCHVSPHLRGPKFHPQHCIEKANGNWLLKVFLLANVLNLLRGTGLLELHCPLSYTFSSVSGNSVSGHRVWQDLQRWQRQEPSSLHPLPWSLVLAKCGCCISPVWGQ